MLSVHPMSLPEVGTSSNPASTFVWKYCRMCALEVKQGVYIFGEEGKRLQIPEKIRKTVAILVLEEDTLPKKICTSCCKSLEAYTQFKDSVVDAQDKLSSIAKSIEKSQEQSLFQLRNQQSMKSPKRSKVFHSALPTHSTCQNNTMLPTSSIISNVEPDLAEPAIECDEPPSSVASISSDEEESTTPKSVSECKSSNGAGTKDDEQPEVAPQGNSPPVAVNKHVIRDSNPVPSQPLHEYDDHAPKNVLTKSPAYNGESSAESGSLETHIVCGICMHHANDNDTLMSHHSKSHGTHSEKDPLFGCSACPRISSNYETIRQHIQRHKKAGVFKCPDCDRGFSTKDHLNVHISSKHNPAGNKAYHRTVHPGCSSSSSSSVLINARVNDSDNNGASASTFLACATVSKSENLPSKSTSEVKTVMSCENNKETAAENVPTSSASPVKPPRKNSNSAENTDLNSRRIVINDSQESANRNDLTSSNANMTDDQDGYWKCDYCDKILRSKNGYDTHIATHKGRRFTCEHCGVAYTQKSSLEHHTKVHHTNIDKEFECPECNKRFKTLRQLSWHKKTHEKPLTDVRCPQCEKTFKNMISFKTHMKLHRGSKKFACSECPKAFYTKAKLLEHMNSHTGRRPFGCPGENCSKVFSCFSNYAKHFKKHHHSMIGPKGSMIPQPKMVESNNNVLSQKPNEAPVPKKIHQSSSKGSHNNTSLPEKETVISIISSTTKSPEMSQANASHPPPQVNETNTTVVHLSYQSPSDNPSTQTQTVLRPLPTIFSGSSSNSLSGQTASTSSQTFSSQTPCSSMQLVASNNSVHSQTAALPPHGSSSNITGNENPSMAHAQSVPVSSLQIHSHSHHHNPNVHHPVNVHAHNNAHSAHSNQPHHVNQFQSQNHIQTVWQPVVLPSSKNYHNISTSTGLSAINGLELLDCAGTVASSDPLTTNANNHSQLQQSNVNGMPTSIAAAHHATSHSSVVHAHQGVSVLTSSSGHPGSIHHHGSTSSTAPHSSGNSSGHHGMSLSSSSTNINIPTFGPPGQQNEPMELSYKDSNNFQDMPMELTKVFQRDPLELCVRQDFGHTQPLMDLSSRVVNVSVGGNSTMNVSTMSMNPTGHSSNTTSSSAGQNHYSTGSTSTSILSVPYHKTVELVERELSLNDFTGAFRQPIDLIARSEDQSHELCSEGSLVDLSLRSSFGQDQSASSFLRELIDLSSRSDSFHGEINLTNKQHQPSANAHSQMHHHHHHHSSGHHPIPKPAGLINNPIHSHHHHPHHSHPHHHHIQSHHQSSNSTGGPPMQTVLYTDTNTIFNMQN